jgi:hypothetical protein
MKRGALIATLVAIGSCVLTGFMGSPAAMIFIIPFSFFWILILTLGTFLAYAPVEERYLRKHGPDGRHPTPGPARRYAYTDPGGVVRTLRHSVPAWSVEAAYDPRDHGRVLPLQSRAGGSGTPSWLSSSSVSASSSPAGPSRRWSVPSSAGSTT